MPATLHTMQAAAPAPSPAASSTAASFINALPADLAGLALLDIKVVSALVGRKSSSIHDLVRRRAEIEAEGGIPFPEPIRMGARCTRWSALSIKQYLQAQIEAQQKDVQQRQQERAKKSSSAAQARRQGCPREAGQ